MLLFINNCWDEGDQYLPENMKREILIRPWIANICIKQ